MKLDCTYWKSCISLPAGSTLRYLRVRLPCTRPSSQSSTLKWSLAWFICHRLVYIWTVGLTMPKTDVSRISITSVSQNHFEFLWRLNCLTVHRNKYSYSETLEYKKCFEINPIYFWYSWGLQVWRVLEPQTLLWLPVYHVVNVVIHNGICGSRWKSWSAKKKD